MSQVLAKFRLTEVTRTSYWAEGKSVEASRVKLGAVQDEIFGPATPQGSVDMLIVNPEAAKVFLNAPIHSEFSILFTPLSEKAE